ncbi:cadherin repeat domain-containing protein, partial [Pandoraea pneumonica]
ATDADLDNRNSLDHRNENSNSLIQNLTYQFELDGLKSIEQSFKINQSTGCISIVKPLDREEFANIDLTAIVDDGYFNATAFISVRVLDDNDNY